MENKKAEIASKLMVEKSPKYANGVVDLKMQEQLRLMLNLFEKKVDNAEKDYKQTHKKNFDIKKMKCCVNRQLKKEREFLIKVNLIPSVQILNTTQTFKY